MEPILLPDPAATLALGQRLAQEAAPGGVLALRGGLGAGKTQLTKGILLGLGGDPEAVSSPTFPLVHEYRGGRLPLFHFDFYRLESMDEVLAIGWDEYLEAGGFCVVEWADLFPLLIPRHAQWWLLELREDAARQARSGAEPDSGFVCQ